MNFRYLFLTLFLSVFVTACGSSSSSSDDPADPPGNENPDDGDDTDDGDTDGEDTDDNDDVTASALVAHYRFENDLTDETGDFNGEVTGNAPNTDGGAVTYQAGAIEGSTAVALDGTSGIALGEGLIGPGEYSISIWLHPDEIKQYSPALFAQAGPNSWVSLVPAGPIPEGEDTPTTMLWAGDGDGTGWFDGTIGSEIPSGDWSHLVFTYSEGNLNTYLNGELAVAHEGFPNVFSADNAVFHIGVNPFELDTPYTGLVDELRIYNVALTQEHVTALAAGEDVQVDEQDDSTGDNTDGGDTTDDGDTNGDDTTGDDTTDEVSAIDAISGLSAHYAFNGDLSESTETFDDGIQTGLRPDDTGQGSITYATGIDGESALALDGSSGVRLPDGLIGSSTFTISLWVNPSELTVWTSAFWGDEVEKARYLTLTPENNNNEVMVRASFFDPINGEDRFVFSNIPESTSLSTNEWAHLAVTVNGSQVRLYIDGELRGSADNFEPIFEGSENGIFALGVNLWDTPFQGLMDQVRIYDRALEAEEVVTLSTEND